MPQSQLNNDKNMLFTFLPVANQVQSNDDETKNDNGNMDQTHQQQSVQSLGDILEQLPLP